MFVNFSIIWIIMKHHGPRFGIKFYEKQKRLFLGGFDKGKWIGGVVWSCWSFNLLILNCRMGKLVFLDVFFIMLLRNPNSKVRTVWVFCRKTMMCIWQVIMEVWILVSLPQKSHVLGTNKSPATKLPKHNFPPKHEKTQNGQQETSTSKLTWFPRVVDWTARLAFEFHQRGPVMSRPRPGWPGGGPLTRLLDNSLVKWFQLRWEFLKYTPEN